MFKECLRAGIAPFIITEATYMPMAKEFMCVLRDTRRFSERHEPW